MHYLGVLFAFIAVLGWGIGDFSIQRTTRKVGDVQALFYICLGGAVVLLPFVWHSLPSLFQPRDLALLAITGLIDLFASLFIFQAYKVGKLSVVEPLLSLELPIALALGVILASEQISASQLLLIGLMFLGLILAVTKHHYTLHYHKRLLEKGVIYTGLGGVTLGWTAFLIGLSSRQVGPLGTIWFISVFVGLACFLYLALTGQIKATFRNILRYPRTIISETVFDNIAWLGFAYAVLYLPIGIATGLTEYYIILAIVLGLIYNRERSKWHQYLGIGLATVAVIWLAYLSG